MGFSADENSFDKQGVTDSIAFKIYKGEKYLGEAMFVREN